jgi:hypothetical protein
MLISPIATAAITLQSLINVLGGFSSLGYTVFGYNNGAGLPDAATQADIDALVALGIPADRIAWIDLGIDAGGGTFVIAAVSSASAIGNVALSSADVLTFVMQDAEAATEIEAVIIAQSGGVFAVADVESLSGIDDVTITSIGQFIVASAASTSAIENVAMVQHGGTFAVAAVASASGIDNVEITEAGGTTVEADFNSGTIDAGFSARTQGYSYVDEEEVEWTGFGVVTSNSPAGYATITADHLGEEASAAAMVTYDTALPSNKVFTVRVKAKLIDGVSHMVAIVDKVTVPVPTAVEGYLIDRITVYFDAVSGYGANYQDGVGAFYYLDPANGTWATTNGVIHLGILSTNTDYVYELESNSTQWRVTVYQADGTTIIDQSDWVNWSSVKTISNSLWAYTGDRFTDNYAVNMAADYFRIQY